jgi:hypothetical protein
VSCFRPEAGSEPALDFPHDGIGTVAELPDADDSADNGTLPALENQSIP